MHIYSNFKQRAKNKAANSTKRASWLVMVLQTNDANFAEQHSKQTDKLAIEAR